SIRGGSGQTFPAPASVVFLVGGRAFAAQVEGGRFRLPHEVRAARSATLEFHSDGRVFEIPGISSSTMQCNEWRILLDTHSTGKVLASASCTFQWSLDGADGFERRIAHCSRPESP